MANVLITGASSGIGRALALAYAEPGARLFLASRRGEPLEETRRMCEERGAVAEIAVLDVADKQATAGWVRDADARAPLDIVIANAGVSTGSSGDETADTYEVMTVNLMGAINTVMPALDGMRARRQGRVVVMSSLYGFRAIAGMPAYCASKAGLRIWGEALGAKLRGEGISVSVVTPGFVRSRLTEGHHRNLVAVDVAARLIKDGVAARRSRIAFPMPQYLLALARAAAPVWLLEVMARLRRIPAHLHLGLCLTAESLAELERMVPMLP